VKKFHHWRQRAAIQALAERATRGAGLKPREELAAENKNLAAENRELRHQNALWKGTQIPPFLVMGGPGLWQLTHRGDPCLYCKKPADEVEPGGCPVTLAQLHSLIGDLQNRADEMWSRAEGVNTEGMLAARKLEEESKRVRQLHRVLAGDMVPAGGARG
jgi:hypothetical protein